MNEIKVELTGITPLLMNNPAAMLEPKEEVRSKMKKYIPKEEAEKSAYKTDAGKLYCPSTAVKGAMINASSFKKAGKIALKPIVAGGVRIKEQQIILTPQKYDLFTTTVVIQRQRVVKTRAQVKDWKMNFTIVYNENMITNPAILKEVLIEAGERVGLLDFSPRHTGEFGQFKVTKFEVA